SPRAALKRLVQQHPEATPEQVVGFLLEEVRDDATLLLPILVYWTIRNMRTSGERRTDMAVKRELSRRQKRLTRFWRVACPFCKAEIGVTCRSPSGKLYHPHHPHHARMTAFSKQRNGSK